MAACTPDNMSYYPLIESENIAPMNIFKAATLTEIQTFTDSNLEWGETGAGKLLKKYREEKAKWVNHK